MRDFVGDLLFRVHFIQQHLTLRTNQHRKNYDFQFAAYTFVADGQHDQMEENPNAKMGKLQKMALNFVISKMFGTGVAGQLAMTVASSACGGGGGSNTSGLVSIGTVKSLAKMCCA